MPVLKIIYNLLSKKTKIMKRIACILTITMLVIVTSCKKNEPDTTPTPSTTSISDTTLSAAELELVGVWILDSVTYDIVDTQTNTTTTGVIMYKEGCYLSLTDNVHKIASDELGYTVYTASNKLNCDFIINNYWEITDNGNFSLGTGSYSIDEIRSNHLVYTSLTAYNTFHFHK